MVLGAVAALAMPPLDFWPLLFVTIPAFLMMLEALEKASYRAAFGLGWALGFGYFVVAFHWIGYAFLVDAETYLWMMPFAVGALAASMAVYWGLAALAVHALGWRGISLVFGFAALLAVGENLRGRLFTGFPWSAPGLAVDGMGALAQGASLIGMTGFTLLLMLWAGLPLDLAAPRTVSRRLPCWRSCCCRCSTASACGGCRRQPMPQCRVWRCASCSPTFRRTTNGAPTMRGTIFDKYLSMSAAASAEHPDGIASITHVIWPESAVPFLIDESDVARARACRGCSRERQR